MKRDMDLVRQILLDATSRENGGAYGNPTLKGYTEEQIDHHIYLMMKAGLVEATNSPSMASTSPTAILTGVTWEGHAFIEAVRSNTVWAKIIEKAKSAGEALTFDLVKEWARSYANLS